MTIRKVAAIFLLIVTALLAPHFAHADQAITRPTVAVVAFRIRPGIKKQAPVDFTDRATRITVAGMQRSDCYRAWNWDKTVYRIADPSLDKDAWFSSVGRLQYAALGRKLGVASVFAGYVTSIAVGGHPRRARVTVSLAIIDVASGEMVNGAISTGFSPIPRAKTCDATLLDQALSDATFNAVKTMNSYQLPISLIERMGGNRTVRIDRGEHDGMIEGVEMVVCRGSKCVGKIRITSVHTTYSEAVITDAGKGIQCDDRALAIFQIPDCY